MLVCNICGRQSPSYSRISWQWQVNIRKDAGGKFIYQGHIRVLFFPLQRFRITDRLVDAIGDALCDQGAQAFTENPIKQHNFATIERRLLLIFDGLDELSKPGDAADKETRLFLTELRSTLQTWNQNGRRVLALVTGRTAAVQSGQEILRLSGAQELRSCRCS